MTIDNIDDGKISGTGIITGKNKNKQHDVGQGYIYFTIDIVTKKGSYTYKIYDLYSNDKTGKISYSDMYNEELYPSTKPEWTKYYREQMLSNMNFQVEEMITKMQEYMKKK